MPNSSYSSVSNTPSFYHSNFSNRIPDSPRVQSSWKSIFRLPSTTFKKTSSTNRLSPQLDTDSMSLSAQNRASRTSVTPSSSLTPGSYFTEQRTSYNSSNTHSTDSNVGLNSKSPFSSPHHHIFPHFPRQKSSDLLVSTPATPGRSRQHAKSTAARLHTPFRGQQAYSADPIQHSFSRAPTRSKTNVPLTPKSVSASATRFIRRVASAPNAKGLFSIGSRSPSATTKNGLLAPMDSVPPLPPLTSSETDQGQDSLETISSSSSRGGRIAASPRHVSSNTPSLNSKFHHGLTPPNRGAFRRTYSSNSIKVRQVRVHFL